MARFGRSQPPHPHQPAPPGILKRTVSFGGSEDITFTEDARVVATVVATESATVGFFAVGKAQQGLLENLVETFASDLGEFDNTNLFGTTWVTGRAVLAADGAYMDASDVASGLLTTRSWDFRESYFLAETAITLDPGHAQQYFMSLTDTIGGNVAQVQVVYTAGLWQIRLIANYSSYIGTFLTYDATAHKWWRFRETGGYTYWDTSPDGLNWTQRDGTASASGVGAVLPYFETDNATSSYAIDNVNSPPAAPLFATLVEDFADALVDPPWYLGNANYTLDTGRLKLQILESYDNFLSSYTAWSLISSSVLWQMETPAGTDANIEVFASIQEITSANIYVGRAADQLWVSEFCSTGSRVSTNVEAWSHTNHAWIRVRESGGTVFVDTSADGTTWTNKHSFTHAFHDLTNVSIAFDAGYDTTDGAPIFAYFDNVNIPPSSSVPITGTESITLTETAVVSPQAANASTLTEATTSSATNTGAETVTQTDIGANGPRSTDAATLSEATAGTATGVGTDPATLTETTIAAPQASNASTFTDVAVTSATSTGTDPGTITEAAGVGLAAADLATLIESGAVTITPVGGGTVTITGTESITETESAAVAPISADAVTTSESGALANSSVDTGILTEASALALAGADTGAVSDVGVGFNAGTASDTGTLTAAGVLAPAGADSATTNEAGSGSAVNSGTDTFTLTESGVVIATGTVVVTGTESITVTDTAAVSATDNTSDSGALTEAGVLAPAGVDSAAASDTGASSATNTSTDLITEAETSLIAPAGANTSTLTDAGNTSASNSDSDSITVADAARASVTGTSTDAVLFTETAGASATGTGTDAATLAATAQLDPLTQELATLVEAAQSSASDQAQDAFTFTDDGVVFVLSLISTGPGTLTLSTREDTMSSTDGDASMTTTDSAGSLVPACTGGGMSASDSGPTLTTSDVI